MSKEDIKNIIIRNAERHGRGDIQPDEKLVEKLDKYVREQKKKN